MATTLLTPAQVADRLQVKERTVSDWLKLGKLNGIRVGRLWRVPETSLTQFLDRYSTGTGRVYSRKQIEQFVADDQLDEETARRVEALLAS